MWEDFKYKRAVKRLQKSRDKIWKEFEGRQPSRDDDGLVGWDDAGAMFQTLILKTN